MKRKHKTKVKKVVVTDIKELTKRESKIKTEETDLKLYLNKMWVQICFNIMKLCRMQKPDGLYDIVTVVKMWSGLQVCVFVFRKYVNLR